MISARMFQNRPDVATAGTRRVDRSVVAALVPLAAPTWPVDWVHDVPASGEEAREVPAQAALVTNALQ